MPELTSLASNLGIAEPHRFLAYGRVADHVGDRYAHQWPDPCRRSSAELELASNGFTSGGGLDEDANPCAKLCSERDG
jgi:hypothetical protein